MGYCNINFVSNVFFWFCFLDVDECVSGFCKNGGKCINILGGYKCVCVGGWYIGRNCDEGEWWSYINFKLFSEYGEVIL